MRQGGALLVCLLRTPAVQPVVVVAAIFEVIMHQYQYQ
jgi:hypothetical protein